MKGGGHPLGRWYRRLYRRFGPQGWWPASSSFEVVVGAILTQNTNWANVERALARLREHGLIDPQKLTRVRTRRLAALIRSSGYYTVKAARIKAFLGLLNRRYAGSLRRMRRTPAAELRQELLSVKGIGPETADSILLYAFEKPVFVIDAYTRRILVRHGLIADGSSYEQVQQFFMGRLPARVPMYNEYHALLVRLAKEFCLKKEPRCAGCPLQARG